MSLQHLISIGEAHAQSITILRPQFEASSLSSDRPSPIPEDISRNKLASFLFDNIRRTKTVDVEFSSLNAVVLVLEPPASQASSSATSSSVSWSDFCCSTGFGAFLLLGCSDSILSIVFLGPVGDTRAAVWDSIGEIGCELSITAPKYVQRVSTSFLNGLPDILTAAKDAISSRLKTPAGSSSGDNMVAGLGAAFAPFFHQNQQTLQMNQQTLEMMAKGAIGSSSAAKDFDRGRVVALQGIVDDLRLFFSLFLAPAPSDSANVDGGDGGDSGDGDGIVVPPAPPAPGAGGIAIAPAAATASVTLPSAKQIDRHAHAVAIRSKLASITGLTEKPYDLSTNDMWKLFGIFDFGPGGDADICSFVRKGESVSSTTALHGVLDRFARFLPLLGLPSLGNAVANLRHAIVSLADQNLRASSLPVQLLIVKHQMSLPFGEQAGRFAPNAVYPVSLSASLSSTLCDLSSSAISTLLSNTPLPSEITPRESRDGKSNNKRKVSDKSGSDSSVKKAKEKEHDRFTAYVDAFKKGLPPCLGQKSNICRSWASGKGWCSGKPSCKHKGLVHAYPAGLSPDQLTACKEYFATWDPPSN